MDVLLASHMPGLIGAVVVSFLAGLGAALFVMSVRRLEADHDGPEADKKQGKHGSARGPASAASKADAPSGATDVQTDTKAGAAPQAKTAVAEPAIDRPAEVMRRHARRILDGLTEGVIGVDEQGRTIFLNPAASDLLGWSARDLMGVSVHHLVMHTDADGHEVPSDASPVHRAMESQEVIDLPDLVLWTKDRQPVHVACTVSAMREGVETTGAVIVFRDLREQRRAEQRFQQLLDAAPDAMVIADESGKVVLANRRVRHVLGHDPEALIGQKIEVLLPEALREAHVGNRGSFYDDPRPRPMGVGLDLHALHADGHEVPVEISLAPIRTADGLLVTAAIRDVTERRRVREQLRHHEIHLNEAQGLAHIGSWEFDIATQQVYWSDELYRMYGLEPQSVAVDFELYMSLIHPDDRELAGKIVQEANETGAPFAFIHRLQTEGGGLRVLEGRGKVVVEDGEPIRMHGTALDITDRPEGRAILEGTELPRRLDPST